MTAEQLSDRALNRATLARQLLLERAALPAEPASGADELLGTIEHLVGLQAQVPHNPFLALWSRVDPFDPPVLDTLMVERRAVRIVMMRGTIHLVSADDCVEMRPLFQPVLDAELARHRDHAPALAGVDLDAILAFGREVLQVPLTGPQLKARFLERFPDDDPAALAYACRNHLGLVQAPPRGLWRRGAQITNVTAEAWLGRPLTGSPSAERMVLRYLAAFGPATVADVAAWSRLTGLGEIVERVRPSLRVFRSEAGRELFDLPDAPRPDPDTPAPPRLLPEYDNCVLSHADRSRFGTDDARRALGEGASRVEGSALVDGLGKAIWSVERDRRSRAATMMIRHLPLPRRAADALVAEARRALTFLEPDADSRDVVAEVID